MTVTALDPRTALVVIDLQAGVVAAPTQPYTGAEVVNRTAELAGAFRARDRRCVEAIEPAQEDLGTRSGSRGDVRETSAIGRERQRHRGPGDEMLTRIEGNRDARQPGPRRRRPRRHPPRGGTCCRESGGKRNPGQAAPAEQSPPQVGSGRQRDGCRLVQQLVNLDAGISDVTQPELQETV